MPVELHPKETLINAALMTRRPVAFLVGSPLSLKDGIGVPSATTMLDFVRDEVRDRASFALPQFESTLRGKSGADAYQAAMKWLGVNAGQDAVNQVIAKAVLQARKSGAADFSGTDGQPDDWSIPAGTTGLAELIAHGGDRFLGPVLTTNFDPLISLAVRKCGGRAGRRVLAADGTLGGAAEDEPGICNVVHLHGFWRDSDTLHTQAQLTTPRPKLAKSLQRLLVAQQRTLIVVAYGGWDDVFTQALVELMNDEQAKLDVIWCFYESDLAKVEERYGKLLEAVSPAIVLNRFRPFGGIDRHSIFAEILSTLRGISSPAAVAPAVSSPLAGWEQIDAAYLSALPSLGQEEVVRYFDGAVPTWRHAVSSTIPRRQAVCDVARRLATFQPGKGGCSMQLIRAAGGEGKTTLLLQAASDAIRNGNWAALWRPSPHVRLLPEHVVKLDTAKQWLIVADDAENLVDDLKESARQLHAAGRSNVHFLLAARDADWLANFGDKPEWETWLNAWVRRQQAIVLRGINSDDALLVVEAWAKCGSDGLRKLIDISGTAEQANVLVNEAQDAADEQDAQERRHNPVEGSFFGGLLAVRFGQNGLQAHVRAFLQRLRNVPIEGGSGNLSDALLYVAACHGAGISGIDERVLADLVGVPREWVQSRIVRPLGEEAAAVHTAGHVLTRHSQVAAAVLVEAEQTLGIDLAEVWAQLVRQTARTGKQPGIRLGQTFSEIVHAGPRLQRALPQQIRESRRKDIAVAAAQAFVEIESGRLDALVDLGKTHRNADQNEQAARIFRANLSSAANRVDHNEAIRGYWYEWGVCEGCAGDTAGHRITGSWLQGLSLSDHLNPAPITPDNGKMICAGLGVAFGKLAQPDPECCYAKARRAVAFLGRRFGYDPKAHYFDHHDREADKLQTPHPNDVPDAIAWLAAGVAQAGRELQDQFLKSLLKPEEVSFRLLRQFFGEDAVPQAQSRGTSPSPASQPADAGAAASPFRLKSSLELRIQSGIERVAREAWEAAASAATREERLRAAKREAERIFRTLSPHIRRQVENHFTSAKWAPLIERDPKHAHRGA